MGNKQSGGGGGAGSRHHSAEPTSRSFSWQPDPAFAGDPIKRGESFTGAGARPGQPLSARHGLPPSQRTATYAASDYGSPGVYRNRQASSPNLAATGNGNGSVVRGDAAFGGVQKEMAKPTAKGYSGRTGNAVNTADSGYMTEITAQDSDTSARARLRGSRLSLNDAMLGHSEFVQTRPAPPMMHTGTLPMGHPYGPMGPHGLLPLGPPPGFGPPPDPFMFPPMIATGARGAQMDEKKAKKLRKKQQKNQHQHLARQPSGVGDGSGEFIPPAAYSFVPAPMIAYGPPHPPPNFRSHSIDNFMAAGLIQAGPMMPPPPPHLQPLPTAYPPFRRYNSHVDISHMGLNYQTATMGPTRPAGPVHMQRHEAAPPKKERKYEKRKEQQHGSLRDSPLGSSRGRLTEAAFGTGKGSSGGSKNRTETSAVIENKKKEGNRKEEDNEKGRHILNGSFESSKSHQRSEVIYETLKSAQRALAANAEISRANGNERSVVGKTNSITVDSGCQDSPPPPTPKQVLITPEAKAILERNARILVEAEREEQRQQQFAPSTQKEPPTAQAGEQKIESRQVSIAMSKMPEESRKIPTPPPPPPVPPIQGGLSRKMMEKEIVENSNGVNQSTEGNSSKQPDLIEESKCKRLLETQVSPIEKNEPARKTPTKDTTAHEDKNSKTTSSSNEKISRSIYDPDDIESMIEAILNPVLPRKKYKRPKDFEPLDAWRGINVQMEVAKRQPQRNTVDNSSQIVEDRIQVRLVPSAPSKREQQTGEPIYLEYDERLPEFKKRLIETGSFDIPEGEKFHHRSNSQPSGGSRGRLDMSPTRGGGANGDRLTSAGLDQPRQPQAPLWRDYVAMEEQAVANGSIRSRKTIDSSKGSLRKLRDSVASMFRTKSTDQLKLGNSGHPLSTATDEMPPSYAIQTPAGRYAPSLTPSTSKIKAGDSSDIDFSWVHDLETRFRLEREQFERELQTLKQKSATLQRQDYMLSPTLQRQNSYQTRNGVEMEENDQCPSFRITASSSNGQYQQTSNRQPEKNFSSSVDLAAGPPANGRMSAYHSQQALNDGMTMDNRSKQKYFGVYDTHPSVSLVPDQNRDLAYQQQQQQQAYERTFKKELQQLGPVNVRQKAALFEHESQRVQKEIEERNQQLSKQRQHRGIPVQQRNHIQEQPYRMSLQHQRSVDADEPIYIPRPDYDENAANAVQHNRQNSGPKINATGGTDFASTVNGNGRYRNGEDERTFGSGYPNQPLMIKTTGVGGNNRPDYHSSPRSPSERRLARYYLSNGNCSSSTNLHGQSNQNVKSTLRYESQPVLTCNTTNGRYSPHMGRYSPGSRSPRLLRAQQGQTLQYYDGRTRNGVSNGFEPVDQQQTMKGHRVGVGASRGVAFAND